jgi:hypothetical protein
MRAGCTAIRPPPRPAILRGVFTSAAAIVRCKATRSVLEPSGSVGVKSRQCRAGSSPVLEFKSLIPENYNSEEEIPHGGLTLLDRSLYSHLRSAMSECKRQCRPASRVPPGVGIRAKRDREPRMRRPPMVAVVLSGSRFPVVGYRPRYVFLSSVANRTLPAFASRWVRRSNR